MKKRKEQGKKDYEARLSAFLKQIMSVKDLSSTKENYLQDIMDAVPFRDLETALMMAMMEAQSNAGRSASR